MSEHPIIMSGDSVRGIQDDRKTMTRRVIIPQPEQKPCGWPPEPDKLAWYWKNEYIGAPVNLKDSCPYGKVGDLLWVEARQRTYNNGGRGWEIVREIKACPDCAERKE